MHNILLMEELVFFYLIWYIWPDFCCIYFAMSTKIILEIFNDIQQFMIHRSIHRYIAWNIYNVNSRRTIIYSEHNTYKIIFKGNNITIRNKIVNLQSLHIK